MKVPNCPDCRDTGTLGISYLAIDPCNCPAGAPYRPAEQTQLPPLPELLPCFNPDCRSTAVHWYSSLRGAQFVICRGCGLSLSRGSQDRTYEAWNALPRISATEERAAIARFVRALNNFDDDMPVDLDEIADRIERQDHHCQCMEIYGENPACPVKHETDGVEYGA